MTPADGPLPEPLVARVAVQFKALAEPLRLRLMSRLFAGEASVGALAGAVGSSLANVSKHLGMLHQAGWIERRKVGIEVRYALVDPRAAALCDLMCTRVRERAVAEAELTAGVAVAPPAPGTATAQAAAPAPARARKRR